MATLQARVNSTDEWFDLPEPAYNGFGTNIQMISSADSGRDNNDGLMHIDKVADKRKFELTYKNVWRETIVPIINLVSHPFFQIKCQDDLTGQTYTGTFYAGDRNATVYSNVLGANHNRVLYSQFTVNFIER